MLLLGKEFSNKKADGNVKVIFEGFLKQEPVLTWQILG